eukprot:Blabericola_migrator_1__1128@NODE_128_length_13299_cov_164_804867_g113_i0_p10_GENE_NODE_128_length_13299_cov_164_804867_g113_i0NODE_128_length_13299_cov_164_804867_g113_i0_p10_ORF_typecomplete_len284_score81_27FKBP_C/PF00254_28/5_5e31TPR_9/PF13371_6/1_1e03TPR_9/PF13371_6/2e07TPR_2/PF07719_17/0_27TPR_2/PF07719_17/3_6e03TPR_2/PF07719_17/0_00033TPR_16/PF13432_6/0_24TPR_16/PF13432_6/0_00046ANAPC3/PF12895_7/1_2e02ANAPC3/PF12895_7/5_4ANAPC3/PF12895_7/0_0014TPR_11/PF13414_6/0_2TPR_11/PF13414_6/5e02TPR_
MAGNAEPIDLLGNGKVIKTVLREGKGNPVPVGDEVIVHYAGTLMDGTEFDSSYSRKDPFTFVLGAGQVIKGWDVGVASMCKGEMCDLVIQPDFAYGETGAPPTIPGNAVLKFRVELLDHRRNKDKNTMSSEERLQEASACKEEGNKCVRDGQYAEAIRHYNVGKDMLQGCEEWVETQAAAAKPLKRAIHLNLAQCHLKVESWLECVIEASAVLATEPENIKALFRRGVARTHLGEYEVALDDLLKAAHADPKNVEIRKAWDDCHKKAQAYSNLMAQTYAKMFK